MHIILYPISVLVLALIFLTPFHVFLALSTAALHLFSVPILVFFLSPL